MPTDKLSVIIGGITFDNIFYNIKELAMALIKAKIDKQRINELKVEYVRDLFEIPSLDLCKMIAIDDCKLRNGG